MGTASVVIFRDASLVCFVRSRQLHKTGVVFLAEAVTALCARSVPGVYQGFQRGDFVTKETKSTFNQIADDQALEHVNKSGKVAGGLVGITRTESARDRWCLTYNEGLICLRKKSNVLLWSRERGC